jgi:O-antigen/teichoic acid export membrane protein
MDNIALLSLGVFQPKSENLGLFGFATTLYSIVLLVPAALVTLGTPKLSRLISARPASGNSLLRLQLLTVAVALPAGVLVSIIYWQLAPLIYPRFAGASNVVFILCAAAPFRALASTSGAFLLVRGRRRIQIWLNLGLAGIAIPTLIVAVAVSSQLWVVAGLMLAGEVVSAASYLAAALQTQRDESSDSQAEIIGTATE